MYWTIELDKPSRYIVPSQGHKHHQPRATVAASTNHRRCGRAPVCGRVCAEVSCAAAVCMALQLCVAASVCGYVVCVAAVA